MPIRYGYLEDYDVEMDNADSVVCANNKDMFNVALGECKYIALPGGTLYLPDNAAIIVPGGTTIGGISPLEGGSAIKGNGTIFKFGNTPALGGAERRRFENFLIQNKDASAVGKLFHVQITGGLTSMFWDRVTCYLAQSHIYSEFLPDQQQPDITEGIAIGWVLRDCEFQNATVRSRHIAGCYRYTEKSCYTKGNFRGLRLGDNGQNVHKVDLDGIMEGHQHEALMIFAQNASCRSININAHFEVNGMADGAADIIVQTNSNHTIRGINLRDSVMQPHAGTQQTERISILEHTAGNIGRIMTGHGFELMGLTPLTGNVGKVYVHGSGLTVEQPKYKRGLYQVFESDETDFSASSTVTIPHGLGYRPKLVEAVLRCISADKGHAADDEVRLGGYAEAGDSVYEFDNISWNATDVLIHVPSLGLYLVNASTRAVNAVGDSTKWKIVVRAFDYR